MAELVLTIALNHFQNPRRRRRCQRTEKRQRGVVIPKPDTGTKGTQQDEREPQLLHKPVGGVADRIFGQFVLQTGRWAFGLVAQSGKPYRECRADVVPCDQPSASGSA